MSLITRIQLSIMMFIQFFIWGAWAVSMGAYLNSIHFTGLNIGAAYSTANWAAVIAPFFVGMIADRFFSAEKVMGVLHLIGGVLMYMASLQTTPAPFIAYLFAYTLCYMPTLALINAISFHKMQDPSKEFPSVRVWGTLGWIFVGVLISFLKMDISVFPLKMAAIASVVMGLYSFTLPNTPPTSTGKKVTVRDILGLDALALMKDFSFLVFVLSSLLICVPLAFYYNFTSTFLDEAGLKNVTGTMSLGQVSEVLFMLCIPFFFKRLGVKKMLMVGMLAWAARYVMFAYGNSSSMVALFYTGIILHGVCYDFFFVTGQLYVDQKAPETIRANAQGFIGLITYGVGMVIGSYISGMIVDHYKIADKVHLWKTIWLLPAAAAFAVLILFTLLFKEKKDQNAA